MNKMKTGMMVAAFAALCFANAEEKVEVKAEVKKVAEVKAAEVVTDVKVKAEPIKAPAAPAMSVAEAKKIMSYTEGRNFFERLDGAKEQVDSAEFLKGLNDALAKKANVITPAQEKAAMGVMRGEMMKKQMEAQAKAAAAAKASEGKLAELSKEAAAIALATDLQTTASGLKYKIIKAGEGESPKATNTATCHYAGFLADGTSFDSSYSRGEMSSFPLNRVIPGWTEGIQLMKPGSEFWFVIPGNLGYGEAGSPPKIPANATLVFKVELASFK